MRGMRWEEWEKGSLRRECCWWRFWANFRLWVITSNLKTGRNRCSWRKYLGNLNCNNSKVLILRTTVLVHTREMEMKAWPNCRVTQRHTPHPLCLMVKQTKPTFPLQRLRWGDARLNQIHSLFVCRFTRGQNAKKPQSSFKRNHNILNLKESGRLLTLIPPMRRRTASTILICG